MGSHVKLMVVFGLTQRDGGGVDLQPALEARPNPLPSPIEVELRRPDGTSVRVQAEVRVDAFETWAPPKGCIARCVVAVPLSAAQVPIGTEIWAEE